MTTVAPKSHQFPSGYVTLMTEVPGIGRKLRSIVGDAGLLQEGFENTVVLNVARTQEQAACLLLGSSLPLDEQEQVFVLVNEPPHLRSLRTLLGDCRYAWFFDLIREGSWTSAFQPVVDLGSGGIYGYEALLRASLPDGTAVAPESVYRAARDTSWLALVEEKSRHAALRGAARLPMRAETIFVNLDPAVPSIDIPGILSIVGESARQPESVIFELVESEGLADSPAVRRLRDELGAAGFRVALDDLTSGFSTLAVLEQLRPDIAKLDRRLITEAHADRYRSRLVQAFVDLCRDLEIMLIAEGVENVEDLDFVQSIGVLYAQGYFLGRPRAVA